MRKMKQKGTTNFWRIFVMVLCLGVLFIGVQVSVWAEEDPLPELPITKLEFTHKDGKVVEGYFEVVNKKNTYSGDLVYVTEVYKGKEFVNWELVNKVVVPFEIYPNETKIVNFSHKLPANISTDIYHMIVKILTRTGLPVGFRVEDIGELEGSGIYLSSKPDDAKFIKNGTEIEPLTGPNYSPNEVPQAYVIYTNSSTEVVKAYPKITVYARDYHFKEAPIGTIKGTVEEFQPGQTKKVILSLPAQNEPESYLASVVMVDENDMPISGTREFRYVITGVSAKILNMDAWFDEATSKVTARVNVIGPADASEIRGAEVNVKVYDNKTNTVLKEETKTINLGPENQLINVEVELDKKAQELRVEAYIKYQDKVLDSDTLKIPGIVLTPEPATPKDVEGTKYEYAVNKLIAIGIINGYEDGTFRPERDITRAEFAKIVCLLLDKGSVVEKAKGTTKFKDVKGTHWASGYINVAAESKLIKGYPGGTFKPENNVTYAEAITILVRALGYGDEVDSQGTWPQNYLAKAAELGITGGITLDNPSAKATRGDIAILTWNTFNKKK